MPTGRRQHVGGASDIPAAPGTWLLLLTIALGPGALSVVLFSYSVPRLGPSSYAIIANSELITVVLLGVLLLGERLSLDRAAGAVLMGAGIVVHGCFRRAEAN